MYGERKKEESDLWSNKFWKCCNKYFGGRISLNFVYYAYSCKGEIYILLCFLNKDWHSKVCTLEKFLKINSYIVWNMWPYMFMIIYFSNFYASNFAKFQLLNIFSPVIRPFGIFLQIAKYLLKDQKANNNSIFIGSKLSFLCFQVDL